MSNNNDYTTGNLLHFGYFKENYKLIEIDLSKQTKVKDPQQINFIGKLSYIFGATKFFTIERSEETTFNFSKKFCHNHINNGNTKNCTFIGSDNKNSKFATKKWYIIDSESNGNYSLRNPIKFLTK